MFMGKEKQNKKKERRELVRDRVKDVCLHFY